MMKWTKLEAFTVLETLITMGVMSVIISLSYYLYNSFSQQLSIFQQTTLNEQNYSQFIGLLKRDVHEAELIQKTANGFEIQFYDPEHKIAYVFNGNRLIRKQQEDTLALKVKDLVIDSALNEDAKVTSINIDAYLFNEVLSLEFVKEYPLNFTLSY